MRPPKRIFRKYSSLIRLLSITLLALILNSSSVYAVTYPESTINSEENTLTTENALDPDNGIVKFRDGKATVMITSMPLYQVMRQLNRLTGVKVSWQGSEITTNISVRFADLPLDEAIPRILRDESYALFYTSDNKEQKLDTVIIVSRSKDKPEAVKMEPAISEPATLEHSEESMNLEELPDMALLDDETKNWIESVGPLLSEGDTEAAIEELTLALNSNANPKVRMMVLETLGSLGVPSLDTIIETALNDPEPIVRGHAAQCLEAYFDKDLRMEESVPEGVGKTALPEEVVLE